MRKMFGYSEFMSLFRVDDPKDLAPGLEVRSDGVYVKSMDDASLLHWSERAVLTAHRTGNLSEPTMPFPFSLSDLKEFCDRHEGMHHAMLPFDLAMFAVKEAEAKHAAASTVSKWPWGDHETELLRQLAAAAERFWKRYDPSDRTTAPRNEEVSDWLEMQGVAKRTATVMATVLRAEGLPTGPRT